MNEHPRPTFSICIPNFNYEKYLGATLRSVLTQDFEDFEVIVADNASTDGSVALVESFRDPRISLVRNRYNVGFAPNLDKATEGARGRFLILLSSDDLMLPGALSTYKRVLDGLGERADNAVLTSAIDVIDGEGRLTAVSWRAPGALFYTEASPDALPADAVSGRTPEEFSGVDALRATLRAKNSPAAFLATCYSRALYERVEGYRNGYRMFPDGFFLNKLLAEDPVFVYVPERLFAYRVHASNQLASEAGQGALKYQVDAYMHTLECPEAALQKTGVKRSEMVDVFVERAVAEQGLLALSSGSALKAFRCLAFGLATYPKQTAREPKAWALAGLLATGPVGAFAARGLYRAYRKTRARGEKTGR